MPDVDGLARRAVQFLALFARRAGRLAVAAGAFVAVIALITYAIGSAALSGGARSTWMILGGALVIVAVGAPLLAWWRLFSVRRHADELVGELSRLISGNSEAERVVIDTVEARPPPTGPPSGRQELTVVGTQQFYRLRTLTLGTDDLPQLSRAMTAATSFPGLLALGLLLSLVLGVLGFVFLLVWIF
jgi:hypothetical protein